MYIIAGFVVVATALGASTPTASEILAQVRAAQSWHDQVRMNVHCFGSDDAQGRTDEFTCQYANRGTDTMYVGSRVMREATGEIWESVHPIYDIKTREFKVSAQKAKSWPAAEGTIHSEPYPTYWQGAETGAPAWGYLTVLDNRHICDVLSEAEDLSVSPEPVEINQEHCLVVSGTTKYGQVKVAVAPGKGYYPVQYHVKGPLTDRTRRPDEGEQDTWVNLGEFRSIDGRWVPAKVSKRIVTPNTEGALTTITWEVDLTDIDLHPVFDEVDFTLGILPDGLVLNDGKMHEIRYIVRNGQLTPEVDDQIVQSMDQAISEVAKPSISVQPPEAKPAAGPVSAEAGADMDWAVAFIGAGVLLAVLAIGHSLKAVISRK